MNGDESNYTQPTQQRTFVGGNDVELTAVAATAGSCTGRSDDGILLLLCMMCIQYHESKYSIVGWVNNC